MISLSGAKIERLGGGLIKVLLDASACAREASEARDLHFSNLPAYELSGVQINALDPGFFDECDLEVDVTAGDKVLADWIARADNGKFYSDVYETFSRLVRNQGRTVAAEALLIARNREKRKYFGLFRRVLDFLFDNILAYGFKPWRALVYLCFLIGLHSFFAFFAAQHGYFVAKSTIPTQVEFSATPPDLDLLRLPIGCFIAGIPVSDIIIPLDLSSTKESEAFVPTVVPFFPIAYGFDTAVPLISLGHKEQWRLDFSKRYARELQVCEWFVTIFGWIFSILFVGTVTGQIKRRD